MRASRLLRAASSRRAIACGGAATAAVYARSQWARADDEAPEKVEPPKKPSIYKEGGFDPTAIEEVAEICRSGMSKSDMQHDIAKQAELQAEQKRKKAEYQGQGRQIQQGLRQAQRQEEEATRGLQNEEMRKRELYKQQLKAETERAAAKLEEAMKDGQSELHKAHEKRLEAIRQETLKLEMELKRETELLYVKARAKADAKAERENYDIKMQELTERAGLHRDAVLEAVKQTFSSLGAGVQSLLGDQNRMLSLAAVVTATAAGFYGARKAAYVLGDFVEARLKKPSLVRETSRGFAVASAAIGSNSVGNLVSRAARVGELIAGKKQLDEAKLMAGAVFEPALENQLVRIAREAAGMRAADAPFRHCLFHGPPGTGKTLFAKKLAAHARMDYAVMSGGDVAPLGRDAVTDIHKLFDWANTSPRGLLLLIDEADAFVRRRHRDMSEDARNALNAFLYRTGSPSTDVLVVFATNAPQLFDRAIHDRVDEVVLFDVPGDAERLAILREACEAMRHPRPDPSRRKWWDFGAGPVSPAVVFGDGVDDAAIERAAALTAGFSARELSKLAIAWQSQAFSTPDIVLTKEDFEEVIDFTQAQNKKKKEWHAYALEKKRKRDERLNALNRNAPLSMKAAGGAAPKEDLQEAEVVSEAAGAPSDEEAPKK